ncbi:MAG: helix-turn-helix transcriptional regulator [Pseudomonadota bacterium]
MDFTHGFEIVNREPRVIGNGSQSLPSPLLALRSQTRLLSPLASMWQQLACGSARIFADYVQDGYFCMELVKGDFSRAPNARDLAIFHQLLATPAQKVVAIERGLSASSVAAVLKHVLCRMGLSCLPSRVPFLLVVSARAALGAASIDGVQVRERSDAVGRQLYTLQGARPWFDRHLTSRESQVAGLLVEGLSHAGISAHCKISIRTVANHLAAIYKKLRVSGRLELLCKLACEYEQGNVLPSSANHGVAS